MIRRAQQPQLSIKKILVKSLKIHDKKNLRSSCLLRTRPRGVIFWSCVGKNLETDLNSHFAFQALKKFSGSKKK